MEKTWELQMMVTLSTTKREMLLFCLPFARLDCERVRTGIVEKNRKPIKTAIISARIGETADR